MFFKKFKIKSVKDKRGIIEIFESDEKFDFKIQRIFYIHSNFKNYIRADHAHRLTSQILICLNGSAKLILDNGKIKKSFKIKKGGSAIYVKTGVWHILKDMTKDCLLLALCDKKYLKRKDYISDYKSFLKLYR
jgi:dTDP-4-dehydrorhamnose 3,5-epimerase-like enzyme